MEHIDRLSRQTALSGLFGFGTGVAIAIYKGRPMMRTSLKVGSSWAIVGTALFGMERIADITARKILSISKSSKNKESPATSTYDYGDNDRLRYFTYSFGGLTGGALVGKIYHQKFLPGMLFFTPVMLCLAFAEKRYIGARKRRMEDLDNPPDLEENPQQ